MNELFALLSFAAGIPLLIIGYIMGIISVKHMSLSWRAGMVLLFPFALPLLALIYWQRAKKPFIYSTVGTLLILYTLMNIPD